METEGLPQRSALPAEFRTPNESFRSILLHPVFQGVVLFALAVAIALTLQLPGRFLDPDSFYHAAMAELAAEGKFSQQFPWLQLTNFPNQYADLHFLYHLILVPFVKIFGTLTGLHVATATATALFSIAFFLLLRRLMVRGAFGFTVLLLSSAAFMFRANLAKAQGFAFLILFLGLRAVERRSYLGIGLAALFATWMSPHWPVLILAMIAWSGGDVLSTIVGARRNWRSLGAAVRRSIEILIIALSGVAAGFIVNPYFPANLAMAKAQIFSIAVLGTASNVRVGMEWSPIPFPEFLSAIGFLLPLMTLALFGMGILIGRSLLVGTPDAQQRTKSVFALFSLTVAFAVLSIASRRHIEFFIPFAILFCAVGMQPIISWMWPSRAVVGWRRPGTIRRPFFTVITIIVVLGFSIGAWEGLQAQRTRYAEGYPHDYLQAASFWIRDNVPEGEIVFHADWDDVPFLLLNDRTHRYLIGLDPRFAAHDQPERYRTWASISRGLVHENVARAIIQTFGSSYAIVVNEQTALRTLLDADPNAARAYEDETAVVFALTP
jgi:hypothetical protein